MTLGYRVPKLIVTPAAVTFDATNWNTSQTFTVEPDQYPPRGTGRQDWTCVTFNDSSTLDFDGGTQCFREHEKRTFQVKRKAAPNASVTHDLTASSLHTVTVPSTHVLTYSPRDADLHDDELGHRPDRHGDHARR